MKKNIFIAVILFFTLVLHAQEDSVFYKHEVRASLGPAFVSILWLQEDVCFGNVSVAYYYRPVKWFWVGGNFMYYFGEKIYYNWREYYPNGNFRDFGISKQKYCVVVSPEVRFSYLNKKSAILYSSLSIGAGWEDGYDSKKYNYPRAIAYYQITYFGFSCNFGKNKNIFLGGELGIGRKGLISMHGGYRF